MKRKVLLVALSATIAIAVFPDAHAERRGMPKHVKKRIVTAGYNYVASSTEQPIEYNLAEPIVLDVGKAERWATIFVEDATTRAVGAAVTQDLDGDGAPDTELSVCGTTPDPVTVAPNKPLTITLGACAGEPTGATSGNVHVEFFSPSTKPARVVKTERTEAFTYAGWAYTTENGYGAGAHSIVTGSSETYVGIRSTDQSGLPTRVQVDPEHGRTFEVCGESEDPIQIAAGSEIDVNAQPGPCADGTPAAMTTGTIEVTLSNAP